jgi:hypothetical protein
MRLRVLGVLVACVVVGCGGGPAAAPGGSGPAAAPDSAVTAVTSAPVPAARDPLSWPFDTGSIWNTPLGAGATLRSADLTPPKVDLDIDRLIVTTAADPLTPTYLEPTFGPGRCAGTTPQPLAGRTPSLGDPIHVPTAFVLPDATATPYSTPNNATAFLDPDGHTLHQFDVTARCTAGGPLYGFRVADTDIRGDGRLGGHLGSGLSSIGGDIRTGELTGQQPLDHALKIDVDEAALSYAAGSATPGYRWPAIFADSYAPKSYTGTDPSLVMGSLLAVPAGVTARSLGLQTAAGVRLLDALQHYGAYIADTTGSVDASLCVAADTVPEVDAQGAPLQTDLVRLMRALSVVTDDGPDAIGGPGRRLAPPAPPLAAP